MRNAMRPRRLDTCRSPLRGRPGNILALTVLSLPPMIGMLGLAIDGGIMLATHRQAQNAADAVAVAAAWDKLRGRTLVPWTDPATGKATTYVQQNEGLADATATVNNPPQ